MPKTIDNDILLMDKTFGFDTAVEEAQRAINSAYIEVNSIILSDIGFILAKSSWRILKHFRLLPHPNQAHSAYHGIGVVKLMGRSSGFIAMHASLASGQIDICLIPEVHRNHNSNDWLVSRFICH